MGWYDEFSRGVLVDVRTNKEVARDGRMYGGVFMLTAMTRDNLIKKLEVPPSDYAHLYMQCKWGRMAPDWEAVLSSPKLSLDPSVYFKVGDDVKSRVWTKSYTGRVINVEGFLVSYVTHEGVVHTHDYTLMTKNL